MQDRNVTRTEGGVDPNGLMAAWLASGGTLDALAEVDCGVVPRVRSLQTEASEDDGLFAARASIHYACGDDGLQAVMNTALALCGVRDDSFVAGGPSYRFPCIDPALQAFGLTRGGIQAC